jgi:hypothetical protein
MASGALTALSRSAPITAVSGPIGIGLGIEAFVSGQRALTRAREYSARVDVLCAKADHSIMMMRMAGRRYIELETTIDSLRSVLDELMEVIRAEQNSSRREALKRKAAAFRETLQRILEQTP